MGLGDSPHLKKIISTKDQANSLRTDRGSPAEALQRDSPAGVGAWHWQLAPASRVGGPRDSATAAPGSARLCASPGATGPGSADSMGAWQSPSAGPTLGSSRALPYGPAQWFAVRLVGALSAQCGA